MTPNDPQFPADDQLDTFPATEQPAFPKMGTVPGTHVGLEIPEDAEVTRGTLGSQWWKNGEGPDASAKKDEATGGQTHRTPGWNTAAGEEIERFRQVPVVGRLSAKMQYTIAIIALVVPLVVLLLLATLLSHQAQESVRQAGADLSVRQAVQSLNALRRGEGGGVMDPMRANAFLTQGRAAIDDLSAAAMASQQNSLTELTGKWRDLEGAVRSMGERATAAQGVGASALDLQTQLADLVPKMQAAAQGNLGASSDLARVLGDLQDWQDASRLLALSGTALPERLVMERQRIEQLLRAFAGSPEAREASPQTQAWRWLAGSWTRIQARMDGLLAQRDVWASSRADSEKVGERLEDVQQTLNTMMATTMASRASQVSLRRATWLAGWVSVLALAFLLFVGWKQQSFNALEARFSQENNELGLQEISQDLKEIAEGNLTRRTRTGGGLLTEGLNKARDRLRSLIVKVKKGVVETEEASVMANEATGVLVDETRTRAVALETGSATVMELAREVRVAADAARQAADQSTQVRTRAEQGSAAVDQVRNRTQTVRSRLEEVMGRSRRVVSGTSEQAKQAELFTEMAEEGSVLASLASTLAAKMGERGLPFQRVAEGVSALSDRLASGAQRLGGLASTGHADSEAMGETLEKALGDIDEGARLNDVAHECMLDVAQQMVDLTAKVVAMSDRSRQQEELAATIESATRQDMERATESRQQAQVAAESVLKLVEAVRGMGAASQEIRV